MAINSNLTLLERLNETQNSIEAMEEILGKGLDQPFSASNSGARKLLYSTQKDHIVPVKHAEPAYVQTGYENRYGDLSSSIIEAKTDLEVIAIIPKFSFAPNHHYYIIFKDIYKNAYDVFERRSYEPTTEIYGYLYNNEYIDSLNVGDIIHKGDIMRKSKSYDRHGNRQDGINLICAYLATDKTMEDSVILSESAAKKLGTTLIKKIPIIINDNDIPLDLYGDDTNYKSWPDIGEEVKDGILCGIRRENREQAMFTEARDRLKTLMMSDDKFTVNGRVIDFNINSNNNDILDSFYNGQLKKYDDEVKRLAADIADIAIQIAETDPMAKLEHNLDVMVYNANRILRGDHYVKEKDGKEFTNSIIEFVVVEDFPVNIGDKVVDRYGGKGVVSFIVPDHLMPRDDLGRICDAIINQSTCVNRENPGQLMETTVTHVGARLIDYIKTMKFDVYEASSLIVEFLSLIAPEEAVDMQNYLNSVAMDEAEMFIDSILNDGMVITSVRPITDNLTLDKIDQIYKHFPFIKQSYLTIPIKDSNGNTRYVQSRRPIVSGHKYMFRLKQFSEEKFSSTSLSATNLRNLNTRSKSSKNYKSPHSNTPVAMGTMEVDALSDVGPEYIVSILMIHSVSPYARRLCEKMLTGDPFAIDIRLDDSSVNRNVEILNTYLKTKGERLSFYKLKKAKKAVITWRKPNSPIRWNNKEDRERQQKEMDELFGKNPDNVITWFDDKSSK